MTDDTDARAREMADQIADRLIYEGYGVPAGSEPWRVAIAAEIAARAQAERERDEASAVLASIFCEAEIGLQDRQSRILALSNIRALANSLGAASLPQPATAGAPEERFVDSAYEIAEEMRREPAAPSPAPDGRVRELVEALRPFAHFGRFCDPNNEDYDDNRTFSSVNITCGMMRRAREALLKESPDGR